MGVLDWLAPRAEAAPLDTTLKFLLETYGKKPSPQIKRLIEKLITQYPSVRTVGLKADRSKLAGGGSYVSSPGRTLGQFLEGDPSSEIRLSPFLSAQRDPLNPLFHEIGHSLAGSSGDLSIWLQDAGSPHTRFATKGEARPIQEGFAEAMGRLYDLFRMNPSKEEVQRNFPYWNRFKLVPTEDRDLIRFDAYLGGTKVGKNFAQELLEGGTPSQKSTIEELMALLEQSSFRREEASRDPFSSGHKGYSINKNYPLWKSMFEGRE
jgi:hypothetical protein